MGILYLCKCGWLGTETNEEPICDMNEFGDTFISGGYQVCPECKKSVDKPTTDDLVENFFWKDSEKMEDLAIIIANFCGMAFNTNTEIFEDFTVTVAGDYANFLLQKEDEIDYLYEFDRFINSISNYKIKQYQNHAGLLIFDDQKAA